MLRPRLPAPSLSVSRVAGRHRDLSEQAPQRFAMIVFHRGWHCPIRRAYLSEPRRLHGQFASRGVTVDGVSTDAAKRAAQTIEDRGLTNLSIGIRSFDRGGAHVGPLCGDEPALFSEPRLFLVRPDVTLD